MAPDPNEALEWAKVLVAAVGGGFIVKLLDIAYLELRRRDDKRQSAGRFIHQHLDPLLKAADELTGKLLSLAREDFKTFSGVNGANPYKHPDFASTAYLISRFWSQVEILKHQALYVSISEDKRGRWLQAFLDCLESRKVRILDRISQRAVGECLMTEDASAAVRYIGFIKSLERDDVRRWLEPLEESLIRAPNTAARQQLLQYGTILHAMIDTLDPDHSVTRKRPAIPNKLSAATRRDLHYRVFGTYLKFVQSPEKYIGRPKKSGGR